jgi:predicted cupin superfamily sugar epimerase
MSTIDPSIPPLHPVYIYNPKQPTPESPTAQKLIKHLSLQPHIEGGYFVELDRDPLTIPNPFPSVPAPPNQTAAKPFSGDESIRNASTSIFYYLSRGRPQGCFHRNKGRTVHTLVRGRGRYVLVHADEEGEEKMNKKKKRVETFLVGKDVEQGERMVWVVEGGKYKASFLVEGDGEEGEEGLLISEVCSHSFPHFDVLMEMGCFVANDRGVRLLSLGLNTRTMTF